MIIITELCSNYWYLDFHLHKQELQSYNKYPIQSLTFDNDTISFQLERTGNSLKMKLKLQLTHASEWVFLNII